MTLPRQNSLSSEVELNVSDHSITLRCDGTVLLGEHNALLVADLHLGKGASFRAAGVPVPEGIDAETLRRLSHALNATKADSLFFLGDLIHDEKSLTQDVSALFSGWRQQHQEIDVTLVRGNHDRHVGQFPESWQMEEVDAASLGHFELRHELNGDSIGNGNVHVGGHVHPVTYVGKGADRVRLTCFVVGASSVVLPAFGDFKGGLVQKQSDSYHRYAITEDCVFAVD